MDYLERVGLPAFVNVPSGAYRRLSVDDYQASMPLIRMGAQPNPIAMSEPVWPTDALRCPTPRTRGVPGNSGRAHEAMLEYKNQAGRALADLFSNRPMRHLCLSHANDLPVAFISVDRSSFGVAANALDGAKYKLESDLANLAMRIFIAQFNLAGKSPERSRDHIELPERNSFGFPTPCVALTPPTFRINLPLAPVACYRQIVAALETTDAILHTLFGTPADVGPPQGLVDTKARMVANLGTEPHSLQAYYLQASDTREKTGRRKLHAPTYLANAMHAIQNATTWGHLLMVTLEVPVATATSSRTVLGSLLRRNEDELVRLLQHGYSMNQILEQLVSRTRVHKSFGKLSVTTARFDTPTSMAPVTPRAHDPGPQDSAQTEAGEVRGAAGTAPEFVTLRANDRWPQDNALQEAYEAQMRRVQSSFAAGAVSLRGQGYAGDVLDALDGVIEALPQARGPALAQAWECVDSLLTLLAALSLDDRALGEHAERAGGNSDSDSEFDNERGPPGERIRSKKFIAHNGMQAMMLAFLAASRQVTPDGTECLVYRPDTQDLYYEVEEGVRMLHFYRRAADTEERPLYQRRNRRRTTRSTDESAPKPGQWVTAAARSFAQLSALRPIGRAFDLNAQLHLPEPNAPSVSDRLSELERSSERIWLIDVTSAAQSAQAEILARFEANPRARMLVLMSSGIKHEQLNGINPYGTSRLYCKSAPSGEGSAVLDDALQWMREEMRSTGVGSRALRVVHKIMGMAPTGTGILYVLRMGEQASGAHRRRDEIEPPTPAKRARNEDPPTTSARATTR